MIRVLASLIFITAVFTNTAFSLTLDQAVQTAISHNPELNMLRLEEDVAKGQRDKAKLPLIANPLLETSGSKKERLPEEGTGTVTNYGVRLSQQFEIAGQRGVRIDVAEKNLARVTQAIRHRERSLVYEVKTAFARALSGKKRVSLAGEVSRLQEELLGFTNTKFEAGEVSALEVNLAEVQNSRAKRELLSAEREYRESILALATLMGLTSGTSMTLDGELSPELSSMPDKESLRSGLLERPDIRAASAEVERAAGTVDLITREAIPNVTLAGFHDRDENRNETGMGLAISIPLFDRKQGEKREAQARASQARIRKAGLERRVEGEFETDYSNLVSSQAEVSIFKKEIVAKSQENLELLNLAFREGKISFFDIRLAQRETIEMQYAYLDALLKAQQAIYAVERTTGGKLQ